jgi:hypothetical protein
MFHYTMFSGTEARMSSTGFTALTLFGAATLRRPTMAQRILDRDRATERAESWWQRMTDPNRNVVVTMFGGTTLLHATLMEEYSALRSLVSTGAMPSDQVTRRMREILATNQDIDVTSITLFGGFVDSRPSRSKQLEALDEGERAGLLPSQHYRRLTDVIDAVPSAGLEVIGELVPEF